MDLGQILDKIVDYNNVVKHRNFIKKGTGDIPWSIRYVNEEGTYVEIAGNEWKMYDSNHDLLDFGTTPEDLATSFKLIYG